MGRLRTNTKAPQLIKEFNNYQDLDSLKLPKQPIYLEIGSGKGDFLITHASNNPNNFYIGIEKYSTVILKALNKIKRNNLKINNLVFCNADAKDIDAKKFKNCINKIYLNFSDPWPKKRHAKRRLTSSSFINLYKQLLVKNGTIEFKTDNDSLYEYTMQELNNRKDIQILYSTNDLYSDLKNKFNQNNVMTEYEKKFVLAKKTINKIIFKFK